MEDSIASPIELSQVARSYGATVALRAASVTILPGDRILLIGANGAGKSTLLRIAAGVMRPSRGVVRGAAREGGFLGHRSSLYLPLTVRQNLTFFLALEGIPAAVERVAEAWGLSKYLEVRVAELSRGVLMRAALARVFGLGRAALFLDEPTTALDEEGAKLFVREFSAWSNTHLSDGFAVVVSHDLAHLVPLMTRVVLCLEGRICREARRSGLQEAWGADLEDLLTEYRTCNK